MSQLHPHNPQTVSNASNASAAAAANADQCLDDSTPHAPADDREEVYFEGSPQLRGEAKKVFTWGLAGIICIAIPILFRIYVHSYRMPWWLFLAFIVLGFVLIIIPLIATRTVRYRVSNYRIDYERGILSKNIDTLELWHIEDIKFHQSLFARIMGVGTIEVLSHDELNPMLFLYSVPNARQLFETLKQRIISVKRQRGVIKVDSGT